MRTRSISVRSAGSMHVFLDTARGGEREREGGCVCSLLTQLLLPLSFPFPPTLCRKKRPPGHPGQQQQPLPARDGEGGRDPAGPAAHDRLRRHGNRHVVPIRLPLRRRQLQGPRVGVREHGSRRAERIRRRRSNESGGRRAGGETTSPHRGREGLGEGKQPAWSTMSGGVFRCGLDFRRRRPGSDASGTLFSC